MKYLSNFKIFEGIGDELPKDDEKLILLNDISLYIKDLDFRVTVNGYESYTRGYNTYDVIIESNDKLVVYDISKNNISELKKIEKLLKKSEELNSECLNLINRSIDSGLYLCEYSVNIKSDGIYCFVRFTNRQDGDPVGNEYKYYDDEAY
jgi:hypothetical protein